MRALRNRSATPPAGGIIHRVVGCLTAFEGPWNPCTWLSTLVFPVLSIDSAYPAHRMGLRCAFPVVLLLLL